MIHTTWNDRKRYLQMHPRFPVAFEALEAAAAKPFETGRHAVADEEIFYVALEYTTKPQEEGVVEGHRVYVDVMYILEGEERISYLPLREITGITKEYDEKGDYFLAKPEPTASQIHACAGDLVIFFPEDGHAPGLNWSAAKGVKKLIAKVLL